jgi:glycosyltransferase XagB
MEFILIFISIIAILQSAFNIFSMLYAWDSEENLEKNLAPTTYEQPKFSFTILLPAWHEENVIAQTITAISRINYPPTLTQILVLLRPQDEGTVAIAKETLNRLNKFNIKIILVNDVIRNKPNQLNAGLQYATGDIVTIFDAEDEPSSEILNIMNTTYIRKDVDIIQGGVQLMDFNSKWFSALNVLEYYFWFKSSLMLFCKSNIMPFGGNTIFIKRYILMQNNGWDESCLTEDCELGIRVAKEDYKMAVIYDADHTTKEETPSSTTEFIKQRTRWTQGFLQILIKGEWKKLNSLPKVFSALYILVWPMFQSLLFFYCCIAIVVLPFLKIALWVSILSIFPLFLLILQIILMNIGMRMFCVENKIKYSLMLIPRIFLTFLPFQAILTYSNGRAIVRELTSQTGWEKTSHFNQHRTTSI